MVVHIGPTVLKTLQKNGVYSSAYGIMYYKEYLKSFEIRVGHSPSFDVGPTLYKCHANVFAFAAIKQYLLIPTQRLSPFAPGVVFAGTYRLSYPPHVGCFLTLHGLAQFDCAFLG